MTTIMIASTSHMLLRKINTQNCQDFKTLSSVTWYGVLYSITNIKREEP